MKARQNRRSTPKRTSTSTTSPAPSTTGSSSPTERATGVLSKTVDDPRTYNDASWTVSFAYFRTKSGRPRYVEESEASKKVEPSSPDETSET